MIDLAESGRTMAVAAPGLGSTVGAPKRDEGADEAVGQRAGRARLEHSGADLPQLSPHHAHVGWRRVRLASR